ncbi:MAG: ornithine cyclodeaminase family protein [Caulobacteraceae bacterium]|nr:ornithine cyclodeaminase family protein [Caulobacteraceae bacterium]
MSGEDTAAGAMIVLDRDTVRARLTYAVCIPLVREAMIALSHGEAVQVLRQIVPLAAGRAFGSMPGALASDKAFGVKVVSVFPERFAQGRSSHQGLVMLFDPDSGAPVCLIEAGEVTAIRTAAASAVATDALARPEASRLAILGYGEQARGHIAALLQVRAFDRCAVWGRSAERAQAFARAAEAEFSLPVRAAATVDEAVADADVICTVTAAAEPILHAAQVPDGCHLNVVGSSRAGPAEIDGALTARARFFADHRPSVLAQGAEFLRAKAAGLVGDDHVLGEIGQVLAGGLPGRRSPDEVTLYKSLGSVVQDLAAGWWLFRQASEQGFGQAVSL